MIYLNNDSFLCDKAISLPRGVFFFFSLLLPGLKVVFKGRQCWWNGLRSGWRREEEALVNTYEQSLSLAVSAEGVDNKEREWSRATFPLERKTLAQSSSFFLFLRGSCQELSLRNTLPFDFYPSLWSCHTNLPCGCMSVSECAHQKACNQNSNNLLLSIVSVKHPFTLISLQAGMWPIICGYRALEISATGSYIEGIWWPNLQLLQDIVTVIYMQQIVSTYKTFTKDGLVEFGTKLSLGEFSSFSLFICGWPLSFLVNLNVISLWANKYILKQCLEPVPKRPVFTIRWHLATDCNRLLSVAMCWLQRGWQSWSFIFTQSQVRSVRNL